MDNSSSIFTNLSSTLLVVLDAKYERSKSDVDSITFCVQSAVIIEVNVDDKTGTKNGILFLFLAVLVSFRKTLLPPLF